MTRSAPGEGHEWPRDELNRPPGYYVPGTRDPAGYTLHKLPGKEGYELRERFEYVDGKGRSFIVPESRRLGTDLASIPALASWLVPKDGSHTQPALLHDAMIVSREKGEAQDYIGCRVGDEEADQIFLEGMRVAGARFVRRWMMWCAVAMRSAWVCRGWWFKLRMALSAVIFAVFGLFALPDVLNFPQYLSFEAVLATGVGLLVTAPVAAIAGKRVRPKALLAMLLGATVLGVALVVHLLGVIPDDLPRQVPSLLPDVHQPEVGWRWPSWEWCRSANDDPLWHLPPIQALVFLVLVGIGGLLNMGLLACRPRLGFLFAVFLALLAYPLFFVLVATAVYGVVETVCTPFNRPPRRGGAARRPSQEPSS